MSQTFDFEKDYILEDDVVKLRRLHASDYEQLVPFAMHEPTLWKFSPNVTHGEDGMKTYISTALEKFSNKECYPFIVFDKKKNAYAGSTRFYDIHLADQCMAIGYTWYGQEFQGTGLNKHCKFLLLSFGFETLGLERIEFHAHAQNERSLAAMKSIGCTLEGILRSDKKMPDGTRRDTAVLSILKSEWFDRIKVELQRKL